MNISIFLAKSIGLYYIILSLAFFTNKKKMKLQILNIMKKYDVLMVMGIIPLIIGILLIVSHNIWVRDWRVIITLIGWLAFTKGICILFFPEFLIKLSTKWIQSDIAYNITFSFVFLIGAALLYFGHSTDFNL